MRALLPLLVAALAAAAGCGTAVYDHRIEVALTGAAESTRVSVFDPQQGSTRDWAHRALGPATAVAPYVATVTTTPAVTIGTVDDARPVTFALAIPDVTDMGYFLLTVDAPLENAARDGRFTAYDVGVPVTGSPSIPVEVTARAEKGAWAVRLTVDLPGARAAFGGPVSPP